MKLLFLEYNSYPIPDAVGNCANKLRRALQKQGVPSDVLTFRWDRALKDAYQDDCGTVYLADSFMYYARVARDPVGRITGSKLYLLRAVFYKALAFLLGGRYVREDKLPAAACRQFGKKLAELCARERYDWVVACGSPFCVLWAAAAYTPANTKLALYYFDPLYYAAPGFCERPSRVRRRLKKELAAWKRADLAVIAPEHRKMASHPALGPVQERILELTFPNMEIPREIADGSCPVAFDPAAVNCVFLGTLYENGRQPEPLLRLFENMLAVAPQLRLYLIGDKFGAVIRQQIHAYEERLGSSLVCVNAIPMHEGDLVQRQADVLINIGNVDQSCLPSKLFDLIASGKPILQISQVPNCNTLPFIERYPKQYHCFAGETGEETVARAAAAFCTAQAGTACSDAELLERYRGVTAHDIAEKLLARMCGN